MSHLIFYQGSATWYRRLIRVADGMVWDNSANALGISTSWTDSALALSFNTVIGGHEINLPPSLPAGEYDILFYDAASPLVTDDLQVGKRIVWNGKGLNGLPVNL